MKSVSLIYLNLYSLPLYFKAKASFNLITLLQLPYLVLPRLTPKTNSTFWRKEKDLARMRQPLPDSPARACSRQSVFSRRGVGCWRVLFKICELISQPCKIGTLTCPALL